MRHRLLVALTAAVLAAAGAIAVAQAPATPKGYLSADAVPVTLRILPPPPPDGSSRAADDRAIFDRTRALKGTPRWDLATSDADLAPRAGMFACALGTPIDATNAPTLMKLMGRVAIDARGVIDPPKDFYARPRPYIAEPDAPICVEKTDALTKSAAYPSGHATLSWAWGMILAEIAPDRATDLLARARAIGESRLVCGVHYLSDVEEGRTNGAALFAALQANADFQADLAKARDELNTARQTPHVGAANCLDADQAAQHPPY
jgi:acid phosphatase (class A)